MIVDTVQEKSGKTLGIKVEMTSYQKKQKGQIYLKFMIIDCDLVYSH